MLRWALLALAAVALLPGCGGGPPERAAATLPPETVAPPPVETEGFDGVRREIVDGILAGRPVDSRIRAIRLGAPPEFEQRSGAKAAPTATWVTIAVDPGADAAVETRAVWEAWIVGAAVWRRFREAGDDVVEGFSLARGRLGGPRLDYGYFFAPDAATYLYTGGDGEIDSLTVDPRALEERIRARAMRYDLTIDEVRFWGVEGTAVEIYATAADGEAFAERWGARTIPPLVTEDVEGVLRIIRDADGEVVQRSAWSSGRSGGLSGLGEKYARFDRYLQPR